MARQHSRARNGCLLASRRDRPSPAHRLLDDLGLLQTARRRVPVDRRDRVRRDRADGHERPGHAGRGSRARALRGSRAAGPRRACALPPDGSSGVGTGARGEDRPCRRARARRRGAAGRGAPAVPMADDVPVLGGRTAVRRRGRTGRADRRREHVPAARPRPEHRSVPRSSIARGPRGLPGRHVGHQPSRGRGARPGRDALEARRPARPRPPVEQRRQGVGLAPAPGPGCARSRPVPGGARDARVRRRHLARDRPAEPPRRRAGVAPHPLPQSRALRERARRSPPDPGKRNASAISGVYGRRIPFGREGCSSCPCSRVPALTPGEPCSPGSVFRGSWSPSWWPPQLPPRPRVRPRHRPSPSRRCTRG